MVFKGGPAAKEKVNDEGMDLVTFIEEYIIANNYEIPHNNEVFISDDEEFIV